MAQRDLFRPSKTPWNARRIIGAKPPLKPKHVWAIRQQLKTAHRTRDLALFKACPCSVTPYPHKNNRKNHRYDATSDCPATLLVSHQTSGRASTPSPPRLPRYAGGAPRSHLSRPR
jgi:hypothetical protein